jgi:mannose-6-phosphate isomerase-like protein (cupin superfamily)
VVPLVDREPFGVLLRGEQSDGAVGITEITVPAGWEGPPLHHHDSDEAFYVLHGEINALVRAHP